MGKADKIDKAIRDNVGLPYNERLSNRALARVLGVDESTVRRRLKKLQVDPFFGVPNSIITQRGSTIRLPDGSYEKVSWRPQDKALMDALSYDDVDKAIKGFKPKGLTKADEASTLIVCAADFQVGKTDERGGTVELTDRVMRILSRWERELPTYKTIVLADLGDVIEGFSNTVQQQQTNDLSLTDQIRVAQRLLVECVKLLSTKCEELIFVAVPSNHATVRSGLGAKARANAPSDDYGLLIHQNIELALSDRKEFAHVRFVRPSKYDETVTVVLDDGTGVGFTHGDLAGNQSKLPQWFANVAHANRGGLRDADILVHGHFHTFTVSMTGEQKWIVGAPSIDNGSAWFANSAGKVAGSAMLTFEVSKQEARGWKLWS